ncbi:MAG: type secretion system protein [Desulfomicrobiaceae bacterium]|jgi:type II secretory ATPase GspE/PulE/Tfp pilus assembly ATPase PilB-like protein|nr:type secretion system protein [Desulfomicrobiaceae bacterium]MBZ4685156.1 type secretion system protein [Desulfomicrobiaceae bacterium]
MEVPKTETQLLTKAWNLFSQENFVGAHDLCLAGYAQGFRSYDLVRLLLDSLNKMGRISEQADLTLKILAENEYPPATAAKLYFRAGLIFQHQHKYDEARELFEKVLALDPAFPGIEQRIKALAPKPAVASSRYSYLVEQGIVSQEALARALESKDPDAMLLGELGVPKEALGESLARFYKTDFVPFSATKEPPFELFEKRRLDPDFLKRFGWIPFEQQGNQIVVLMLNPYDLGRLDEIRFIYGTSSIVPKVTLAQDLEQYIDHFYRQITGGEDLASAFDEDVTTGDVAADDTLEADLSEQDSEVVRMVNALLVEAWRKNVSDIHIEPNPFSRYCLIRFRIDGTCHEFRKVRLALARPIVSRLKIMAHLDIAERRLPQDGKIKIKLPDRNQVVEYRMATIPTIENQEDVVLRVLASGKPLPLDKLGLLPRNQAAFEGMIRKPYGLILVVGPTGSGKTTTLHSAVSYINTPERKIWTAEDPVEITQEGLRQVQVQPKIGLTFAAVLRSFLRADPDVIMIGEMRDKETAHIGVEASLTGHLVFSTLHTNSAPETVTRLLDMDLDPFNFADSLLCVLAQRLVKTLCPHCKEAYPASEQEIEDLRMEFGPGFDTHAAEFLSSERTLYRKVGCPQCMGSGYKGRVGIHELMLSSEGIKTSIKYRKPTEEIRSQAVADGMLSLKQDGILKVLQGRTDMEQVRAVAG